MNKREWFRFFCVPRCPCCHAFLARGEWVLCDSCRAEYDEEKERECSLCFQTLPECKCAIPYLEKHKIREHYKITRYRPDNDHCPSAYLIYSLKQDYRSDVYHFLADELAEVLLGHNPDTTDWLFTNVPRRRASRIRYGYDHARLLARCLAKRMGCDYRPTLRSCAKVAQKELDDEARFQNANFLPLRNLDLHGKTVVLVDDIVTTGASMGEGADLLYKMGARRVFAASISIAYSDPYTPPLSSDSYVYW